MPGLSAADVTKATELSLKSGGRAPVLSGQPALSSGTSPAQQYDRAAAKHLAAVAQSFAWAEESAARGDYVDALGWIAAVEATGDRLSDAFETKRHAWVIALADRRGPERETADLRSDRAAR